MTCISRPSRTTEFPKAFAKGCSRLKRLTATPKNLVPPKRYIQPGDLPDGRYKILDDFVENARMQRSLTLDYYGPTQTWLPKMCFVPNTCLKELVKESWSKNLHTITFSKSTDSES